MILSCFLDCWVFLTSLQMPTLFLNYDAQKTHTYSPTQVGSKICLEYNTYLKTAKTNTNTFFLQYFTASFTTFHLIDIRPLTNFQTSSVPLLPSRKSHSHHAYTARKLSRKTLKKTFELFSKGKHT